MDTQQHIDTLQSRQLELLAIMARSDAHAAKCLKMGILFRETYPQDYAQYQAANAEFNNNQTLLDTLATQRISEQAEERVHPNIG